MAWIDINGNNRQLTRQHRQILSDEHGVRVKASRQGRLKGADSKPVSAEQMEIARLRAELARVKMERDILGKATAYFAKAAK